MTPSYAHQFIYSHRSHSCWIVYCHSQPWPRRQPFAAQNDDNENIALNRRANLERTSEMCCTRLAEMQDAKNNRQKFAIWAASQLRTKACIENPKKTC